MKIDHAKPDPDSWNAWGTEGKYTETIELVYWFGDNKCLNPNVCKNCTGDPIDSS